MYARRRSGRVVLTYFLIMNRSTRSNEECSSNWSDWRAGSILSEETATGTFSEQSTEIILTINYL